MVPTVSPSTNSPSSNFFSCFPCRPEGPHKLDICYRDILTSGAERAVPAMTRNDSTGSGAEISRLRDAGDYHALVRLLGSTDSRVSWQAAEALGSCGEALPLLSDALRSGSATVRLGALEALAAIRDPRGSGPVLRAAARDPVLEVRWAAILALGEIG